MAQAIVGGMAPESIPDPNGGGLLANYRLAFLGADVPGSAVMLTMTVLIPPNATVADVHGILQAEVAVEAQRAGLAVDPGTMHLPQYVTV